MGETRVTQYGVITEVDNEALDVTQFGVITEADVEALSVTQFGVITEISNDSIVVTQFGVLSEIGNDGIAITQFGVLTEFEVITETVATYFDQVFNRGPKPHHLLPDDVIGYQLDEGNSFWSVIVPEATENLILNPSFELTDSDYTIGNFTSYTRTSEKAAGGFYCEKLVPLALSLGYIYTTYVSLGQNWYTFSLDIYHTIGQTFTLQALDMSAHILGTVNITARNTGWNRYSLTYYDPGTESDPNRHAYLFSASTNSGSYPIYTDRWQVEAKTYPTTYCDGDMQEDIFDADPYAYGWSGKPHQSTSVRSATTFGGGRIISFYDIVKFKTTGVVGLGLADATLDLVQLADGIELMRGFTTPGKDFSVVGKIFSANVRELQGKRLELINLLNQAKRRGGQMVLRYQPVDYHGRFFGKALNIKCAFSGGLSGNFNSLYQETLELKFRSFDAKVIEDFSTVQELEFIKSFENGNPVYESGAIERDPLTGEWDFLADTASVTGGDILCACYMPDGRIAVGGSFTVINGVSAYRVAIYDPRTGVWDKLGSSTPGNNGFNNTVYTLAVGKGAWAGYLIAGGAFTGNAPSTTVFQHVAYWDFIHTTHWNSMVGLNDTVYTLAVDSYGNIHAGGDFTQDGAATTVVKYGIYTPGASVWTNVFVYLNAAVRKILIDPKDLAYIAGDFLRVNTETLGSHIINYDHYNQPVGPGDPVIGLMFAPDKPVLDMAFAPDGTLHICGNFVAQGWYTTVGPDVTQGDCFYVAKWNGARWEDYGQHLVNAYRMAIDKRGISYVSCNAVADAEYTSTSSTVLQAWNGSSWFPFGARGQNTNVPTTGQILVSPRGKLLICYGTSSEVMTPGHTTVNYEGSMPGKVCLRIHSESNSLGRIHSFSNWTTGQHIYFKDIQIYNDDFYLDMTGIHVRVYSTEHGDLTNQVMLGISDLDQFSLAPGNNDITLLIESDNGADITAFLAWHNQHASIDIASQSV